MNTRRAILTGAAALPVIAALPQAAAASMPIDPVVPLWRQRNALRDRGDRLLEASVAERDEAWWLAMHAYGEANARLVSIAHTSATTLAGCAIKAHMLRYSDLHWMHDSIADPDGRWGMSIRPELSHRLVDDLVELGGLEGSVYLTD